MQRPHFYYINRDRWLLVDPGSYQPPAALLEPRALRRIGRVDSGQRLHRGSPRKPAEPVEARCGRRRSRLLFYMFVQRTSQPPEAPWAPQAV